MSELKSSVFICSGMLLGYEKEGEEEKEGKIFYLWYYGWSRDDVRWNGLVIR